MLITLSCLIGFCPLAHHPNPKTPSCIHTDSTCAVIRLTHMVVRDHSEGLEVSPSTLHMRRFNVADICCLVGS